MQEFLNLASSLPSLPVSAQSSDNPEPWFDLVTLPSKDWHRRLPAVWSQPALRAQQPLGPSMTVVTHLMPCGESVLSSCLVILSKPFLPSITLCMSHMLLDYSSWQWSLFPLCFSISLIWSSPLALTTDCFVFSHLYILVAQTLSRVKLVAFVLHTVEYVGPRGTHGRGKNTRLQSQDTMFPITDLSLTGFVTDFCD